jgi:hypothetical protein
MPLNEPIFNMTDIFGGYETGRVDREAIGLEDSAYDDSEKTTTSAKKNGSVQTVRSGPPL